MKDGEVSLLLEAAAFLVLAVLLALMFAARFDLRQLVASRGGGSHPERPRAAF